MPDRTVSYIEDNFHNRRLVRKILAARGFRVVEAETGAEGMAMLRESRPPLLLLDIGLPDVDGLEIVRWIRSEAHLEGLKVIAITASAMRGDRERFLEAGCDDYLSKPIQAMELINLVERYYPSLAEAAEDEVGEAATTSE